VHAAFRVGVARSLQEKLALRTIKRREFLLAAVSMGASAVFASTRRHPAALGWTERRDLYPEGVASGDPRSDSVILWTRRPFPEVAGRSRLQVEVAEDPEFRAVIAQAPVYVSASEDWTCRVLAAGLSPSREYWYRFVDATGLGSRIGRTLTTPKDRDDRPSRFAFVSCQNVNTGAQNAYRRMIFDDERAPAGQRLDFVLHLGDFIYELVWYPEDRPQGMYDRQLRDIVRYPSGEKIDDFHIPTTLDDYRAVYRAYLQDPDLQDARARWPFVPMWDNHEFSWLGWQGFQKFDGVTRPAQTRKVAANQAWFEYQPARIRKPGSPSLDRFDGPSVLDAPVEHFDESGLGQEPNNLAAIGSLTGYRVQRCGRHVELIITDQRSYRSQDPVDRPEAKPFQGEDFPELIPEEIVQILDAGRDYDQGRPPPVLRFGESTVSNFRAHEPAQTILGAEQKRWFLERLRSSTATWKIWGNTIGTLDYRADPQNLPAGLSKPWPGAGFASVAGGDFGDAFAERGEIYDFVAKHGISGFVTVAGDRHSFWAGLAAKALPPKAFEPVGIAFVTGSLSAPGVPEAMEHRLPNTHPLRALYLLDGVPGTKPEHTVNLLMHRGVRSCLEYQRTRDIAAARVATNPELAPHLSFLDWGGHGYAVVHATSEWIEVEFVCIPRPIERNSAPDGGPLRYRVTHRAQRWRPGSVPQLEQRVLEGNPALSI
jgi:alkaline phosphatase D